jgi:Xaa-Pro aminopeptidase
MMPVRSLGVVLFILLLPVALAAQEGIPFFTTDFPPEEFGARRAKLFDEIGSGKIAVVQGAPSPAGFTRFRQSNEFYYLCGVESPHAYLLLDSTQRTASLYVPHRNEGRERVEGKVLSAEDAEMIRQLSGVNAVYGSELLAEHLARYARNGQARTLLTPFSPAEGLATSRDGATRAVADAASDSWDGDASREGRFAALLRTRFPQFNIEDLSPALDKLRLIKSAREITLIRKATRLSSLALLEAMRSTAPGIREYELDAVAKYVYYRNGAQGDAYYSLVASGTNAWYPHYNAGKRRMQDGDFLLMDYAPDVGYYMSDVTRMWPVNGKFNAWQRELYGFYLECYQAILKHIRPAYERAAREFVESYGRSAANPRTSLGHWVGMATHDVGQDNGALRAGMVFTIEPALRVPEEKIYIRLEDVIVITDKGADILTDWLPMDIPTIEKVMSEEGMLQRYPRDRDQ